MNLIERLRGIEDTDGDTMLDAIEAGLFREAADEIERLEGVLADSIHRAEYEPAMNRNCGQTHHAECWRQHGHSACAEREMARLQERLEGVLRLYGEHTPECGCWDKMDSGQLFARHDWQCTCGFREALDKEGT